MQATVKISNGPILSIEYEYVITAKGHPGHAASFASPGEPPSPMEFEIEVVSIATDERVHYDFPHWLQDAIEEHLAARDDVYEAILSDARG